MIVASPHLPCKRPVVAATARMARLCNTTICMVVVFAATCLPVDTGDLHAATAVERRDTILGTGGDVQTGREPATGDTIMQVTPPPPPLQPQYQTPLIIAPEIRLDGTPYVPAPPSQGTNPPDRIRERGIPHDLPRHDNDAIR